LLRPFAGVRRLPMIRISIPKLDELKQAAYERGKRAGAAEERERCAKIAEYAYRSQPFLAQPAAIVLGGHIADAIREGEEADDE